MATPSSTKDTFEDVLRKCKTRLTPKESKDFSETSLADVQQTILRIQKDQEQLKRATNLTRLRSFLEAMDQLGKTIEVFLNSSPFLALVWGPMRFMLLAASSFTEDFDILLDAYENIGAHIPFLEKYRELFQHDDMKKVLALIYEDIIEFHSKALRYFTGKVWQRVFRAMWRDFKTRFDQILTSLERHKVMIREQAEILSIQRSQQDRQTLSNISQLQQQDSTVLRNFAQLQQHDTTVLRDLAQQHQQDSDKIQEAFQLQKYDSNRLGELVRQYMSDRSKQKALIEWFSMPPGSVSDHKRFCETRSESRITGRWILENEKIRNWTEEDPPSSSMLWLSGKPGAGATAILSIYHCFLAKYSIGKTILASVIIENCLAISTFHTAYFYCKEGDPVRDKAIGIYRSLLGQLLGHCPELVPYCYEKRLSSGDPTLSSTDLMEQLLKLFLEKIPQAFIILDGLDECAGIERKTILSFLTKMVQLCDGHIPGKLRVLIISQDYVDIGKLILAAEGTAISLGPNDNSADIKGYTLSQSLKLQCKFNLDDVMTASIQEKTFIRADGMFLYAKLVMENLLAQEFRDDLLSEIGKYFPDGLGAAFQRILDRIKHVLPPSVWRRVQKLLGWLVCVRRPLKSFEIQALISIDPINQTINFQDKKLHTSVEQLCGSLITVLPNGRGLELVHNTAKIHIAQTEHVRISLVESELATLCLRYLLFQCFKKDLEGATLQVAASNGQFAFQDYATAKWFHHFHTVVRNGYADLVGDPQQKDTIDELGDTFEDFVIENSLAELSILPEAHDACGTFVTAPFFEDMLCIWTHLRQHEQRGLMTRDDISLPNLGETLARNRKIIEDLPALNNDVVMEYYGEKIYKCPKITCFYFHEGFKDASIRDQHINRHERPFICNVPECNSAEFGFTSNKDLERHMKTYHPDVTDLAESFPNVLKPSGPRNLTCDHCSKTFTRAFHKRNHMRTHFGERPFSCEECGKAFTRANDCKRHAKIHSKR
ncbi:C2H2 and C2HC zinc finger [Venturia nashicola]|uniref:C2H2 and C2HC zinc finger n=1 Tax=Venturia nashicola TaxID=86259 RepID=A0A4Z1P8B2_9PEZI|nr:C2H2 and C2HC zinc finger [Venturia nashicola]